MAENKTQITDVDPADFIAAVDHDRKREEAKILDAMFRKVTGLDPKMWGPSIIGYGAYHYRYASGHEGDAPRLGFSPRKAKHSIYVIGCGDEDEETASLRCWPVLESIPAVAPASMSTSWPTSTWMCWKR